MFNYYVPYCFCFNRITISATILVPPIFKGNYTAPLMNPPLQQAYSQWAISGLNHFLTKLLSDLSYFHSEMWFSLYLRDVDVANMSECWQNQKLISAQWVYLKIFENNFLLINWVFLSWMVFSSDSIRNITSKVTCNRSLIQETDLRIIFEFETPQCTYKTIKNTTILLKINKTKIFQCFVMCLLLPYMWRVTDLPSST